LSIFAASNGVKNIKQTLNYKSNTKNVKQMKTTNNYEAPVAEMIEMHMPVVLNLSGGTTDPTQNYPDPNTDPSIS
jgi:hypothetical protein